MTRSHPPTLLTLSRRALAATGAHGLGLARGSRVLVAVSGGPDSMALLHVLARLRDADELRLGLELVAHGVDHGLRSAAASELDLAEALARTLDVPFARTRVDVAPGGNLQARARDARYAALRAAAATHHASVIATAHHADDRAETVLLRLLRGAGPRGLAVLPPRAGDLVRPFLRARRADILAHLARHGIAYAADPSNVDPRFSRVRVRHELLPLLTELSPAVVDHLCALADQLASLDLSPEFSVNADGEFDDETLNVEGTAHSLRLPRATQLALAELAHSPSKNASVELPGGVVAHFDRGKHTIVTKASAVATWRTWKHRTRSGRHQKDR